jgi:L-arabinose isomerase
MTKGLEDKPLFNVDIWNNQGEVVKHFREITAAEVDEIMEQYEDEPWLDVVVDEAR